MSTVDTAAVLSIIIYCLIECTYSPAASCFDVTTVSAAYSMTDFRAELRTLLLRAGSTSTCGSIVLLLTEAHLSNDHFIPYIIALLSGRQILGLFSAEEQASISEAVAAKVAVTKAVSARAGVTSAALCWEQFWSTAAARLHCVLCLDPALASWQQRVTRHPALYSSCTINWLHDWPKEAFTSVARKLLLSSETVYERLNGSQSTLTALERFFVRAYDTATAAYCSTRSNSGGSSSVFAPTPRSHVEAVRLFVKLLERTVPQQQHRVTQLERGCARLAQSAKIVSALEGQLAAMLSQAEATRAAAQDLDRQVSTSTHIVCDHY
jgi:P-loop containing dynein motor region D4